MDTEKLTKPIPMPIIKPNTLALEKPGTKTPGTMIVEHPNIQIENKVPNPFKNPLQITSSESIVGINKPAQNSMERRMDTNNSNPPFLFDSQNTSTFNPWNL